MTQLIRPFPRRDPRPARRPPSRVFPRASAMRSRAPALKTAAALALTLGLAGCAATNQPREDVQPEERGDNDRGVRRLPAFRALDTDDDGGISAGEIDAAPESLASLDDDGDGRLSAGELRPRRGGPRVFFGNPANLPEGTEIRTLGADEALDIADLPPQFRSLLSSADADGDGAASAAEILGLAAETGGPRDREPGSAEGPAAPSQGTGSGGGGPQVRMPLMAAFDADQDGTISETEIESAAQSLRRLDTDGDGRISPDELQPASSRDSSGNDLPE